MFVHNKLFMKPYCTWYGTLVPYEVIGCHIIDFRIFLILFHFMNTIICIVFQV